MIQWECAGCQTIYQAWLSACPRCHGNSFKEINVPKLRVFGDQVIESKVSALADDVVAPVDVLDTEVDESDDVSDVEPSDPAADGLVVDAPFDPAEHPVPVVLEKLDKLDDDQKKAVLTAEAEGKNRAGIVGH